MDDSHKVRFGSYQLDPLNEQVWHGEQVIHLKRKTLRVLQYLVQHAGQLVTKEALFAAVWPETVVSDVVLAVCIRDLRKAFGDNPKVPQFIETVHRRRYRFIASVQSSRVQVPGSQFTPTPKSQFLTPNFVGREAELGYLGQKLERVLQGERQLVFVTGEERR